MTRAIGSPAVGVLLGGTSLFVAEQVANTAVRGAHTPDATLSSAGVTGRGFLQMDLLAGNDTPWVTQRRPWRRRPRVWRGEDTPLRNPAETRLRTEVETTVYAKFVRVFLRGSLASSGTTSGSKSASKPRCSRGSILTTKHMSAGSRSGNTLPSAPHPGFPRRGHHPSQSRRKHPSLLCLKLRRR